MNSKDITSHFNHGIDKKINTAAVPKHMKKDLFNVFVDKEELTQIREIFFSENIIDPTELEKLIKFLNTNFNKETIKNNFKLNRAEIYTGIIWKHREILGKNALIFEFYKLVMELHEEKPMSSKINLSPLKADQYNNKTKQQYIHESEY